MGFNSGFKGLMIDFCRFFNWIALGDVDLLFSLVLARKADAVEGGTSSAA